MNVPSSATEVPGLLRLAGPLIAAQLAQNAMGFVDTVMVGGYGALDLAAVAVGAALWQPPYLLVLGILMALSPSVAHLYGQGRTRDIGFITTQGLWLAGFLTLPVLGLLLNAAPLLRAFDMAPEVIPLTQAYLDGVAWGMPAVFAFTVLRYITEGVAHTRPVMVAGLVGLGVNIFGNWSLIYGRLGLPELGVAGCGLATALSFWVMALFLGRHLLVHPRYRSYELLKGWQQPRWRELWPLIWLGLPIGLAIFAEVSIFAAVALILGSLGPVVLAGHQIALNVASTTFMVPLGLSMAVTVKVGQARGAGDRQRARRAGLTGIVLAAGIMLIMAGLIYSLARPIAALYSDDPPVVALAAGLLQLAALFQLSDGLQVSAAGALRGLKDTRVPLLITLLAYWGVGLPLGYVLALPLDFAAPGAWVGLLGGLSTAALLLGIRFWRVSG
ncbi:MAG: MATE family efflux transporter [Candidatus Competibacteraceae bacterium]|nr:MATE family efflux transporter [Candidatus Competibacteraceae bacterium]